MKINKGSISKEQLKVQKDILNVAKSHKEISQKQLDSSMSKREQRGWLFAGILATLLVSGSLLYIFNLLPYKQTHKDYDVKIEVSPDKVMLNQKGQIEFTFTFTNNGLKNISDFKISSISLYRIEDGKPVYKYELLSSSNGGVSSCSPIDWYEPNSLTSVYSSLPIGKSCKIENIKMYGLDYISFFDDKNKQLQFYVYIKSIPPIENKIVNLSIY